MVPSLQAAAVTFAQSRESRPFCNALESHDLVALFGPVTLVEVDEGSEYRTVRVEFDNGMTLLELETL